MSTHNMFFKRNKTYIMWILPLICSYVNILVSLNTLDFSNGQELMNRKQNHHRGGMSQGTNDFLQDRMSAQQRLSSACTCAESD